MDKTNPLNLQVGQRLIIKLTVEDVAKANELLAWLYRGRAVNTVHDYGCQMESLGWKDKQAELEELLEPIKQAVLAGRL